MENENIPMRIIKVVNKLGITMSEFARKIDVTPAYISKLGKQPEKCRPSGLVINNICQAFNVNKNWLVSGDGGDEAMFLPVSNNVVDRLCAEMHLTETDRILIEKFIELPSESRQAVMDYAMSIAKAAQDRATQVDDSTEDAETAYRSSSGFVPNTGLSALNITGDISSPSDKSKEKTITKSGGGESGNEVG